jgi:hypothetical protein
VCGLRIRYSTDLSDPEWEILCPLVPAVKPGGRPAKRARREILNALAYWLRAGCAWRLLPARLTSLADGLSLLAQVAEERRVGADADGAA